MSNLYYHSFYLIVTFFRKIYKKEYEDPNFASVCVLSLCFASHIVIIMGIIGLPNIGQQAMKLYTALFILPVLCLNYYFLMHNNRADKILKYYDEKYKERNISIWTLILIIGYIIISFVSCGYLAYLLRNHLI